MCASYPGERFTSWTVRVPSSEFSGGKALVDVRAMGVPMHSGPVWIDAVSCTVQPTSLVIREDSEGGRSIVGTLSQHNHDLWGRTSNRWNGGLFLEIASGDSPPSVFITFVYRITSCQVE